jgi:CRP-like cAMP-binding protein
MDLLEIFEDSQDVIERPAGAIIFEEGDDGDYMYVILQGKVRLSLRGETIGAEFPGGIVGEMALLNSDVRSATATTETTCKLALIDRECFIALIRHTPEFALHVMNVLADRLRLANEILAE